ncbi:MAG: HlyC/CorC family transporter [Clostridia bacterium]|nr:HlyC/CorC family transporter [Clostridia bacterium]
MEPHLVTYLVIILICIILSAYFSATETAFSTFNRIRVKNMAEKGNKKAAVALKLADNYDSLISTILIGNNIVNILSASLATLFFTGLIKSNPDLAATVSTIVLTLIVLMFGEISPKTMAKNSPDAFVLFSAPIIKVLVVCFTPLNFVISKWQALLAKLTKNDDDKGMTEEELISIIEEAEEDGGIDEEESSLIKSAIEFGDLEVGDIFTPRIDITSLPVTADKDTVEKVFTESGYSRIPVYENDLDNVLGILYYKDFFALAHENSVNITEILKPVIFVAKTQKVNDLMKDLQEKQLHMAVVTDEYGSTAGIVTLEDILEEIVGDIWDEHDEIVEEIKDLGDGEYEVSGMANIEKLFDELEIELDEELDAATANGWAMAVLERIPEEGDVFEYNGLSVKVLQMDGRRIQTLHIVDTRPTDEDKTEESDETNNESDSEQ